MKKSLALSIKTIVNQGKTTPLHDHSTIFTIFRMAKVEPSALNNKRSRRICMDSYCPHSLHSCNVDLLHDFEWQKSADAFY